MKLSKLMEKVDVMENPVIPDMEITGIKLDSRKVIPGDLFVAIPGFKEDGARFIQDAKTKGATAVVTEKKTPANHVPAILVRNARKSLGRIARTFYGNPDERLSLFGITGTNGKTTTAHLIWAILGKSGHRASLLGTIQHNILGRKVQAANTTPEAMDLYSFFKETLDQQGDSVVMEVSSHALSLNRVEGILFSVAVFTNLTHDHLDFHKNFEDYFQAKSKLFTEHGKPNSRAVINADDPYGMQLTAMLKMQRKDTQVTTFGMSKEADVHPLSCEMTWDGIRMELKTPWGNLSLQSPLSGTFNVSNIMAAASACLAYGIKPEAIASATQEFSQVPGRFETVRQGQNFAVVVDYAHTPDALERVLKSARALTKGKLLAVFGCGGDRDRKKRPIMGEIASRIADLAYVTSDNPRTENPDEIIKEILAGIKDKSKIKVESDRRKAIEAALAAAAKDDCVVIAGKGHEDYQIIGATKHPFNDREMAKEILARKI